MGQKHIILRGTHLSTRDPMIGTRGVDFTLPEVSVETADLSPKELSHVTRERDVVAVAPAIPMRLIEPTEVAPAAPAAAGTAWGVAAVGADTSPFTGSGAVVSVLDTGIDAAHPAFSSRSRTSATLGRTSPGPASRSCRPRRAAGSRP
jgi:subtilisin family serine protease